MKTKILYTVTALLMGFTAVSCRDESTLGSGRGEGTMTLRTSVESEIRVVSRALTAEQQNALSSSALIWISDPQKGLLYKFNGTASFPAEGLPLTTGSYVAEAWVGDSIPASWTGTRYHGRETFDITAGANTAVNLVCPVRNTLVSVNVESLSDVLSDVSFEVSLNDGITDGSHSLTFEGDKLAETGYFMLNTRTKGFKWTLKGTDVKGNAFSRSGEYKDPDVAEAPYLSRSTHYKFAVKYNGTSGDVEIGGAYFDIDVQPEPVEGITQDVLIAMPPEIVGIDDFDVTRPVLGEPGNVGRKSIHIIGASPLTSVVISGNLLTAAGLEEDYDLLDKDLTSAQIEILKAKGVDFVPFDNREEKVEGECTNIRINLDESMTNSLIAGEYQLAIVATDNGGRSSNMTIAFNITDAPGQLAEFDENMDIDYHSASFSAIVKKPGSRMGFEVKKLRSGRAFEDWTFIEGQLNGNELTATALNLDEDATYSYRLVIDDWASPQEPQFYVPIYPQLPNAGFEEWFIGKAAPSNKDNTYLPNASADLTSRYWDCGNHGSITMGKNVTVRDENIKHSGNYSIKLESQFVGLGVIGKFAAGNIFVGQYLKTDGTDGVLGWGRPWTVKPKALKGYVKYTPATVAYENSDYSELKKGDMDKGIIYIAMLDDSMTDFEGSQFPVVVKTKKAARSLFAKTDANVIAYGEKVFDAATPGDGMIEFEIPLEYFRADKVYNIVIVASASKGGDYFVGGPSSMWLDDLQLVY